MVGVQRVARHAPGLLPAEVAAEPLGELVRARFQGEQAPAQPARRLLAAMANGRCHLRGGTSTGPRTAEGLERLRAARTRHGAYTAEALALRYHLAGLLRRARALLERP